MRCAAVSARYTTRTADVSYEISIATNILFDGFAGMTANGVRPSAGNRSCPCGLPDFNHSEAKHSLYVYSCSAFFFSTLAGYRLARSETRRAEPYSFAARVLAAFSLH